MLCCRTIGYYERGGTRMLRMVQRCISSCCVVPPNCAGNPPAGSAQTPKLDGSHTKPPAVLSPQLLTSLSALLLRLLR